MQQDISDATTYELEASLTRATIMFNVIACPHELSLYRTRQMANGIKQCRHYILWMDNECEEAGMRVNTKLLIKHPANDDHFKEKTIYNELSTMRSSDLLCSDRHEGEILTVFGKSELSWFNVFI